jgi:pimeloyl-ACP methyl ester carboxylesterase
MPIESPFAAKLAELPQSTDSVTVLGSETHYWTYGPDDAHTTIVICHGYRGEHHGLEPVIANLRGFRIIGPDLPGFGDSTPLVGTPHSIAGYADWFAAFIEALDLDTPPVILGHSFGSIVTSYGVAHCVLSTPKLILVNPIAAPYDSGPFGFAARATLGFYRVAEKLGGFGRWMLGNPLTVQVMSSALVKTKDRSLRRWIHDQHHTYFSRFSDLPTVVESFVASTSTDVSVVGARIAVPTLLIGAELDLITPVSALHALQNQMPDATLHVIDGVGHLIHYEKAEITATMIVDFLAEGSVAH